MTLVIAVCWLSLTPAPVLAQAAEREPARLERWTGEIDEGLRDAGRILRESRAASSADDGSAFVKRLVSAASHGPDALVEILVRARVPETGESDDPQILSAPQRALVLAALARLPSAKTRAILADRLEHDPTDGAKLAMIHVFGAIGKGIDMANACELAPLCEDGRPTRSASDALRRALTSILQRDVRSWELIPSLLAARSVGVQQVILSAVAETEDPRAFTVMFDAARAYSKLEQQAVSLLRPAARGVGAEERRECTDWLVSRLSDARPDYLRSLLQAIGHMDDGGRVPELFGYLADENPNVRDAAGWALRKITGATYPTDARLWATWYAEERRWMERERPRLRERLWSYDREAVVSALRRYAERRTFRDELVTDLFPLLSRPEEDLIVLTCEVIARLDSGEAVHDLLSLLDDSRPRIVAAATSALAKITGRTLPPSCEEASALIAAQ